MAKAKEKSARNPGPLAPGMEFDDVLRKICAYRPPEFAEKKASRPERLSAIDQLVWDELSNGSATAFDIAYEVGIDHKAASARLGKMFQWGMVTRIEKEGDDGKYFLYERSH